MQAWYTHITCWALENLVLPGGDDHISTTSIFRYEHQHAASSLCSCPGEALSIPAASCKFPQLCGCRILL